MAARKKKAPEAPRPSGKALMHGKEAYGARFLRPGFSFSDEWDLAWACGFPFMRFVEEGHPSGKDPAKFYTDNTNPDPWHLTFAPSVALRHVRYHSLDTAIKFTEREKMAAATDTLIDFAEFREGVIASAKAGKLLGSGVHITMLLAEAVYGPDLVADTLVACLEATPTDKLNSVSYLYGERLVKVLSNMLLRVQPNVREQLVGRLGELLNRIGTPPDSGPTSPANYLYWLLNPQTPDDCSRIAFTLELQAPDDRWEQVFREKIKTIGSAEPEVRRTFVAGEASLELEHQLLENYHEKPHSHRVWVAHFGLIRSQHLLPLMLKLSATSPARKDALAWFALRKDFALPYLAEVASQHSKETAWAQTVLEALEKA